MESSKQKELNRQLFSACCADPVNYSLVEALLQQGAEPMGEIQNKYGEHVVSENLYREVVDHWFANDETPEDLFLLTELFLKYGMDISKPSVPYPYCDDGNHPLWMFAFFSNECVMRTLKLFLDHGVSAEEAGYCWGHAIFDLVNLGGTPLNDSLSYEIFYDYIRKLMLIASYPHILDNDEDLQEEIWLFQNNYELRRFRNWNDFKYEISTPSGAVPEDVYKSVVTIIEKETGTPVWRFGVCLDPDDYPELWLCRDKKAVRKKDLFWSTNLSWYSVDEQRRITIRDDAPLEAKQSYENYQRQLEEDEAEKRNSLNSGGEIGQ